MEKQQQQNRTIKNGCVIKTDKNLTKGLKISTKAETEFIIEPQTPTVWKQQYHVLWNSGQMATIFIRHIVCCKEYTNTLKNIRGVQVWQQKVLFMFSWIVI